MSNKHWRKGRRSRYANINGLDANENITSGFNSEPLQLVFCVCTSRKNSSLDKFICILDLQYLVPTIIVFL